MRQVQLPAERHDHASKTRQRNCLAGARRKRRTVEEHAGERDAENELRERQDGKVDREGMRGISRRSVEREQSIAHERHRHNEGECQDQQLPGRKADDCSRQQRKQRVEEEFDRQRPGGKIPEVDGGRPPRLEKGRGQHEAGDQLRQSERMDDEDAVEKERQRDEQAQVESRECGQSAPTRNPICCRQNPAPDPIPRRRKSG